MLFYYWPICISFFLPVILLLGFCATVAHFDNSKRKEGDPEKKDYAPQALWLTPCTPLIWLGKMILLAPWSILFGIFLILFPFILILFRPAPENDPIKRLVLKIGNGVLELNTRFLSALGLYTKPVRFSA